MSVTYPHLYYYQGYQPQNPKTGVVGNQLGLNNQVMQNGSFQNVPGYCTNPPVYNYAPPNMKAGIVSSQGDVSNQSMYNGSGYCTSPHLYNYPIYYFQGPTTGMGVAQTISQAAPCEDCCPWVSDPSLKYALTKLAEITHDSLDVQYLNANGINVIFNSGKEALDFIRDNQIAVEYVDMGEEKIHAQYSNSENKIQINQKYKDSMTLPVALAIADAIYHEVGHAKDKDDKSSLQEETECLALNVLGYRFQQRKYPQLMSSEENSKLLSDGVALYPKLFFDQDPFKNALIKRLSDKYGTLPKESPNHRKLANNGIIDKAKQLFNTENTISLKA